MALSPESHDTSSWLQVWTPQQTKQPTGHTLHSANDASLIVKEIWFSVVYQLTLSNATKPMWSEYVYILVLQQRKTIAHISGAAQWTLWSRCDRNKDCCHLRVRCTHTKPRSSLSAQMCHRSRLTALLHAWVFHTYWKSITIFQWQLQEIFELPVLGRVWSDFLRLSKGEKPKEVKWLFDFISVNQLQYLIIILEYVSRIISSPVDN